MRLSAPIYVLKRNAKLLARESAIPLHQALDKIAAGEGFQSWSHLVASSTAAQPAHDILEKLEPGDMVLIGARPGQGKTLLGLELAARARQIHRKGYFFTLDYTARDISDRFAAMGIDPVSTRKSMVVDTSDDVSVGYILRRLAAEDAPVLMVIDYLQLLDQKRTHPSLSDQITSLRHYVKETGAICVAISQIDRSFDLSDKTMPDISDVRLPNPLDLSVFEKRVFLHNDTIRIERAA